TEGDLRDAVDLAFDGDVGLHAGSGGVPADPPRRGELGAVAGDPRRRGRHPRRTPDRRRRGGHLPFAGLRFGSPGYAARTLVTTISVARRWEPSAASQVRVWSRPSIRTGEPLVSGRLLGA